MTKIQRKVRYFLVIAAALAAVGCSAQAFSGVDRDGGTELEAARNDAGPSEATPADAGLLDTADGALDGDPDRGSVNDVDPKCEGDRVAIHRSYNWTTGEHTYTTSESTARCCGRTVDFLNYFYLRTSPGPGVDVLYSCREPGGRHFLSLAPDCRGGTNDGVIGYIGSRAECGSVPLYYLVHPYPDHLYTISEDEKNAASSGLGYEYKGVLGYVWLPERD